MRSQYDVHRRELGNDPQGSPPVFPIFLSGGLETFRLSPSLIILLAGYGITLLVMSNFLLGSPIWQGWLVPSGLIATAVASALLTALLAANWLGASTGAAAGLIQLSSLGNMLLPANPLPIGPSISLLSTIAVGMFAVANVPGRMPAHANAHPGVYIHVLGLGPLLLFGPAGPLTILIVCLAWVLLNQDGRALRTLVHPLGLCTLGLFAAGIWWFIPALAVDVFCQIVSYSQQTPPIRTAGWYSPCFAAIGMLPWTPLGLLALATGWRRGHYATAFWQLVTCWWLTPLLLAASGAIDDRSASALAAPPLAILAAEGLAILHHNHPLRYGKTARTAFRTGRPGMYTLPAGPTTAGRPTHTGAGATTGPTTTGE